MRTEAIILGVSAGIPLLVVSACTRTYSPEERANKLKNAASKVVVADGINEKEAAVLAANYYWMYIGIGCGGSGPAIDKGDYWEIDVRVGYAATRIEPIRIEKNTGRISRAGGPTIENPVKHFTADPGRQD